MRLKPQFRLLTILMTVLVVAMQFAPIVYAVSSKKPEKEKTSQGGGKKDSGAAATSINRTYNFTVNQLEAPESVRTNQAVQVEINITNKSNFKWLKNGAEAVFLAYHWVDQNGEYEVFRGDKTSLVRDVLAGGSVKQKLRVKAPNIPGKFTLKVDAIQKDTWFTLAGAAGYDKKIKVVGTTTHSDEALIQVNAGAEFTNKSKVEINFTRLPFQPSSGNAAFIFNYAQSSRSSIAELLAGEGDWGVWRKFGSPFTDSLVNFDLRIDKPYVGEVIVNTRFRAFKKSTDATPASYGSAQLQIGSSAKTSSYYSDSIFFDNVPPSGGVEINGGAYSTTSRYGNLRIWADDVFEGVAGSGIEGMRIAVDCNQANLKDNVWTSWQSGIENKTNYFLGEDNNLVVCVQVRDNAGNVATFVDEALFYIPQPAGNVYGEYTIGSPYGPGSNTSPFAGLLGSNLPSPYIEFDRFIRWDGAEKWNAFKKADALPKATITYVKTNSEATQTTLYGIAIPKGHPIGVGAWNEFRYCWACGSGWEYFYQQSTAQHVKIVLFKSDWTYLGHVWNDRADGRWQLTLPVGTNLKVGEKVFAEVQVEGDYYFNDLHWWHDTTENNVHFDLRQTMRAYSGHPYWSAGASNTVQVPSRWIDDPVMRAIVAKEDELGNVARDGVLHQWCGYYLMDYSSIGDYGDSILMYNPNHQRAYLLTGGIWYSYYTYGGCGRYGLPLMDGAETGGQAGWYQDFEKASIYWAQSYSKAQPGIVEGQIRNYYHGLYGTWSSLGFPEGQQWSDVSACDLIGQMQHFQGGKVFSSPLATMHLPYGEWFDYQNQLGLGGESGTGWPRSNPYSNGLTSAVWEFERGTMNWNFTKWFTYNNFCSGNVQNTDPDLPGVPAIHVIEDTLLAYYERADGDAGIPHSYCDGLIVDYKSVTLVGGKQLDYAWVIYNPTTDKAYLTYGEVAWKYWRDNGCGKYGLPFTHILDVKGEDILFSAEGLPANQQNYQKGSIYAYQRPNSTYTGGADWVSYGLLGDLNKTYLARSGPSGSLRLPTSETTYGLENCNRTGFISAFRDGEIHFNNFEYHFVDGVTYDKYKVNGGYSKFGFAISDKYLKGDNFLGDVWRQDFNNGYIDIAKWGLGIVFYGYENDLKCWQDTEFDLTLDQIITRAAYGNQVLDLYIYGYPALNDLAKKGGPYTNSAYAAQVQIRLVKELNLLRTLALQAALLNGASYVDGFSSGSLDTQKMVSWINSAGDRISLIYAELEQAERDPSYFSDNLETLLRYDFELGQIYADSAYWQDAVAATAFEAFFTGSVAAVWSNPSAFTQGFVDEYNSTAGISKAIDSLKFWEWMPALMQLFSDPAAFSLMIAYSENASRYKLVDAISYDEEGNAETYKEFARDSAGNYILVSGAERARSVGVFLADSIISAALWETGIILGSSGIKLAANAASEIRPWLEARMTALVQKVSFPRLEHVLKGTFNSDGTFKSGAHYYKWAQESVQSGKIKAGLKLSNETGFLLIDDLAKAPVTSKGIIEVYFLETRYSKTGAILTEWKYKTIPRNFTILDHAMIGYKLQVSGTPVSNTSRYMTTYVKDGVSYKIEGYISGGKAATWYVLP